VTAGRVLLLALLLILVGDLLSWTVQTGGGRVRVHDVRWVAAGGTRMSGLLYVPPGATPERPAPAILAIHGYINSRESQAGFAIEFARRGFVVLAVDQTGHGYSDPPAFRNGYGGPDALVYLRSLDFVDGDNVGLEGHSMGGWAVLLAAAAYPAGYRSVVLEGSSTGTGGAPDATDSFPRNLAVVFSKYDEFSQLMWGTRVAADVSGGTKLKAAFGVGDPVEEGRIYGSLDEGTARVLYQPPVTHPGDHFSRRAIGHAVDWFQRTLEGGSALPSRDQVWIWKEVGNLVALAGMVLLLFPVGLLLLRAPFFADLAGDPPAPRGRRDGGWWVGAVTFAVLPAATLFPFKEWGGLVPVTALFPQSITTQVAVWALLVAAVSAGVFAVWHRVVGRREGTGPDDYGLTWGGRVAGSRVGRSFLLAALVALAGYATLVVSGFLFRSDYRFWVFAVKPMSPVHLRIFLAYLAPFLVFFLVYGVVLFGQLRRRGSAFGEMLTVVALSTSGFAGLLVAQYAPLFLGGTLLIPSEPLWTILAFQFLPLMTIVGLVTAFFQRRTGHVYVGAFLSALLVTWIVVSGQATHHG
jgi:pimeloyl-ACP methyl ester carboxylesterase